MNEATQPKLWEVRGFYNEKGRQPDHLVAQTWHTAEVSADMEIRAFRSRRDIGRVEIRIDSGPWRPA